MKYFANPIKKKKTLLLKEKVNLTVTFFLYVRGQVLFTVEWAGAVEKHEKTELYYVNVSKIQEPGR